MNFEQIGQKLKSARDGTGLSLAQIQEKTKIPYNHLAAIDTGNFDDLPEPVYVSGFLKRYAECVGLDGQELVDEYRSELDASLPQPQKTGFIFKGHKNNGNNMPQGPAHYNRQPIEHGAPNLIKIIPFYAMWIVLILVLVIYLVNRQGASDQAQQDSALLTLKQSTAVLNNAKVAPPQANTGENATSAAVDNNANEQDNLAQSNVCRITLRAKNHVWVEVKATSTGESLFNSFLEPGDNRDFTDKEGLWVRAGNGGNVIVTAAGKTAELGALGKITEKTFANKKVNQVAQSKTETNKTTESKTTKTSASSTTTKPASPSNAAIHKKSGESDATTATTPAKKSAIASTAKSHPVHPSVPVHETGPSEIQTETSQNTNANSNSNTNAKPIDVPYRYSE